jgi:hypothetical protein
MKPRFRVAAKIFSAIVIVLLVIMALGPENWTPRTPFGWQFDHFIGYFAITLLVCFAWPPPARGWGNPHGRCVLVGRLAGFYARSVSQLCRRIMRRRRGASGGSRC